MRWDPEVESPATIAVIGAGPVGIEAALYARFLGYNVDIFDTGRPAKNATRWHQRPLGVTVDQCTTSLGHAALLSQDVGYKNPEPNREFTGQAFADEYLIPLAKSDLLVDGVHINSQVIEVSRLRTSLEDQSDMQERCNDEFRLLIRSRDRGLYTHRADIVLDCRGSMSGECGWGPAGSQSIGATEFTDQVYRWLPSDSRFEIKSVQGLQTILFGQSPSAIRFAREWSQLIENCESPPVIESLRRLAPIPALTNSNSAEDFVQPLDLKMIWLIPTLLPSADDELIQIAAELSSRHSDPKQLTSLVIRGIERVARNEAGRWTLELLQADDSTVELSGEVFAAFPDARPTPAIGPELCSQEFAFRDSSQVSTNDAAELIYRDWPGWQIATYEPQYYRLGSIEHPNHPQGLFEAYQQIRDLFALLGARATLNLYDIVRSF